METLNDLIPLRDTEPVRPFCWERLVWWTARRLTDRWRLVYRHQFDAYGNQCVGLRVPAGVLHVVTERGPLSDVPYQLWL